MLSGNPSRLICICVIRAGYLKHFWHHKMFVCPISCQTLDKYTHIHSPYIHIYSFLRGTRSHYLCIIFKQLIIINFYNWIYSCIILSYKARVSVQYFAICIANYAEDQIKSFNVWKEKILHLVKSEYDRIFLL